MATLGKALGVAGAFVAGSAALIDGLVQGARTFVYTTALPPALAAATCAAIDIARFEGWRRDRLARLIAHFRHGAAARGIGLAPRTRRSSRYGSATARRRWRCRRASKSGLLRAGDPAADCAAGQARLRVALSALHAEGDVERLLDALGDALHVKRRLACTPSPPKPSPFRGRA